MKSSKPWMYAAARTFDRAAGLAFGRNARPAPTDPARILVSNVGHLGDALLTLGMPMALRRLFPHAEIDVLVSSVGARLFAGMPQVSRVFVHDALLLRRGTNGPVIRSNGTGAINDGNGAHPTNGASRLRSRASSAALREREYDIALELRSYVPNSMPLLASAGAGFLCGFGSAGFSFLLDRVVPHVDGEHELHRFERVTRSLVDDDTAAVDVQPSLDHLIGLNGNGNGRRRPYTVLHPGTRRRRKRWNESAWRDLAAALADNGMDLLITGSDSERAWLESTFHSVRAEIVTGALDVAGLARLYSKATTFVGVDSFPAHLAATAGTRHVVVLWHEYADPAEWAPVGDGRVTVLPGASTHENVLRVIEEAL